MFVAGTEDTLKKENSIRVNRFTLGLLDCLSITARYYRLSISSGKRKLSLLFFVLNSVCNLSLSISKYYLNPMRFEISAAEKMSVLVFRVVTMCGLVGIYQRFGEIFLLLQD
jgi:hypothetical protein